MGQKSHTLNEEETFTLQKAVELYVYDSPWQKWVFKLYKKTMSKTWFRFLYVAIWILAALTYNTAFGKAVLFLSLSYFIKLFVALFVSHIIQGCRWRIAYRYFKRKTGISHISFMSFKIIGRRFVKP